MTGKGDVDVWQNNPLYYGNRTSGIFTLPVGAFQPRIGMR